MSACEKRHLFQNEFLNDLVAKYDIGLDTPTNILKQFVLEFNPLLTSNGYPKIKENIRIVRCYQNDENPGHKGTSICESNYSFILLYVEFFKKLTQCFLEYDNISIRDPYIRDIRKSYISTLLHEMAHQVRASMDIEEEVSCIDGHDSIWMDCAKLLGVEAKYLETYMEIPK